MLENEFVDAVKKRIANVNSGVQPAFLGEHPHYSIDKAIELYLAAKKQEELGFEPYVRHYDSNGHLDYSISGTERFAADFAENFCKRVMPNGPKGEIRDPYRHAMSSAEPDLDLESIQPRMEAFMALVKAEIEACLKDRSLVETKVSMGSTASLDKFPPAPVRG